MLATSLASSFAGSGPRVAVGRLFAALAICGVLVAFESVWRRSHDGEIGLGMGDIKCLATLMIADPVLGVSSFISGLLVLAVTGTALRVRSLPLLPFVTVAWLFLFGASLFGTPLELV